jgi:hypothetical protein
MKGNASIYVVLSVRFEGRFILRGIGTEDKPPNAV